MKLFERPLEVQIQVSEFYNKKLEGCAHSTSGPLPVNLGLIDDYMRRPIIQFYIKIEIRKICRHTNIHTGLF